MCESAMKVNGKLVTDSIPTSKAPDHAPAVNDVWAWLHTVGLPKQSNHSVNLPHRFRVKPCCNQHREASDGNGMNNAWTMRVAFTLPDGRRVRLAKGLYLDEQDCGQILDTNQRRVLNVSDLTENDYRILGTGELSLPEQVETLEELLENATGLNPADPNQSPYHARSEADDPPPVLVGASAGLNHPGDSTPPEWIGAD